MTYGKENPLTAEAYLRHNWPRRPNFRNVIFPKSSKLTKRSSTRNGEQSYEGTVRLSFLRTSAAEAQRRYNDNHRTQNEPDLI